MYLITYNFYGDGSQCFHYGVVTSRDKAQEIVDKKEYNKSKILSSLKKYNETFDKEVNKIRNELDKLNEDFTFGQYEELFNEKFAPIKEKLLKKFDVKELHEYGEELANWSFEEIQNLDGDDNV